MFFRFGLVRKALMTAPMEQIIAEGPARRAGRSGDPAQWARMDRIARVFMRSFSATLEEPDLTNARFVRDTMIEPFRGVSVEGIAMGLTVTELTTPFSRVNLAIELAEDFDGRYRFLAYVGMGIALARLNRHPQRYWNEMHPAARDVLLDGYGFAHGLFKRKKTVEQHRIPRRLAGGDLTMFDEGLGRLIWILSGGDVHRIAETLRSFGQRERALWAGVGVACTYVGASDRAGYAALRALSAEHYPALARGCALACHQRALDQYVPDHSALAAREMWSASALEVAERARRCIDAGADDATGSSGILDGCERLEREAVELGSTKTPRETALPAAEQEVADA